MHFNRICVTWVTIVGLTLPVLFSGSPANAQTAACCLGDQCQVLEQAQCEDAGGLWLARLNPAILDCSDDPCATGACCYGAGCEDDLTPVAVDRCNGLGGVFHEGVTCDGTCPSNDYCQDAYTVCENNIPDADVGYCDNDDALDPGPVCSISAQDCYDGSMCVPWGEDGYRCLVPTDNRLASTDGPPSAGECAAGGEDNFQADIWYQISAPCNGNMSVSMCNSAELYDSMLAVFGDHSATPPCPGSSNEDLLTCNDDFCAPLDALSAVQTLVSKDASYLVRVGGWRAGGIVLPDVGRSELNIGFLCYPPVPPVPPVPPPSAQHQAHKNRYVTIDAATNDAVPVAYEVTLASMKRCTGDDRRACVVDADCPNVCDNDDDLQCGDNDICGGGTCVPTGPCVEHSDVGNVVKYIGTPFTNVCLPLHDCTSQWFANLVDTPVYRVWTENTLHIAACEIVPAAVYEIRATYDGAVYGDSLTIGTIPKPNLNYADCVGPVVAGQFTPPDGITSVLEVQAYLIAVQGGATAPHTTWVDLHGVSGTRICDPPIGACIVPQQILGVSDLQTIKFGFAGKTYTETPGHENPGDCS
jgi:hypothetical protein